MQIITKANDEMKLYNRLSVCLPVCADPRFFQNRSTFEGYQKGAIRVRRRNHCPRQTSIQAAQGHSSSHS